MHEFWVTRRLWIGLGFLLLGMTTVGHGQGGGPVLYENGSPDMGISFAGAGARAQDAATVFSNPAGMTRLKRSQVLLGTFAAISNLKLELGGGTISDPPGSLDGGGSQSNFAPGLGSYFVWDATPELKVGMVINALAATGADYNPNWVGRALITESFLVVGNLQPTVAYRFHEMFSLGVGINVIYGRLDQKLRAGNAVQAPTVEIDEAEDWEVAATIGGLFELSENTRFGLTYRSEIGLELKGRLVNPTPLAPDLDTDFDLAQGINLSAYHAFNSRWAVLGDLGWSDWSTFSRQPLTIGPVAGAIDRHFKDTYRIGLGVEYRPRPDWILRSGFSFDSSPVDDKDTLPDIPVGDQYRFSVGMEKDFGEGKMLGLTYSLLYQDAEIDRVLLPPGGTVLLDGDYDPYLVHFLGATLKVDFGQPREFTIEEESNIFDDGGSSMSRS